MARVKFWYHAARVYDPITSSGYRDQLMDHSPPFMPYVRYWTQEKAIIFMMDDILTFGVPWEGDCILQISAHNLYKTARRNRRIQLNSNHYLVRGIRWY